MDFEVSSGEFTQEILDSVKQGWSFLPIFGSGISINSGAPSLPQLTKYYLPHLIRQTVKINDEEDDGKPIFNPNLDPWPSMKWENSDFRKADDLRKKHLKKINELSDYILRRKNANDLYEKEKQLSVLLACEGSLHDWTLSLRYLSQIQPPDEGITSASRFMPGEEVIRTLSSAFQHALFCKENRDL